MEVWEEVGVQGLGTAGRGSGVDGDDQRGGSSLTMGGHARGSWEQGRLNGVLSVCRAFGDFDYASRCKHRGLSAEPDVWQEEITEDDEFLLVASDGLWSKENGTYGGFACAEKAVEHLREQLMRNNNDVDKALER